jgi:hypothetical protein
VVDYAATFFFVADLFAAGLMEVGAFRGVFSFLGCGGTTRMGESRYYIETTPTIMVIIMIVKGSGE